MFFEAMKKEIADHQANHHWTVIPLSEVPKNQKLISAVWSFKRKRLADGRIDRYKARLCAHGGQQVYGINYWETYAPVVSWMTVRLMLTLTCVHNLSSKSIDFTLAFPQATLDEPVYMRLPIGCFVNGDPNVKYVCRLEKNVYGLKNAGYNWFKLLSQGLSDRGFKPSMIDGCLFIRKDCFLLVYVDDIIVLSKDPNVCGNLVQSLLNGPEKFKLTEDSTFEKYLGVKLQRFNDGSMSLSQPYLIDRIIKGVYETSKSGFEINETKIKTKETPASSILHKDSTGKERLTTWHYRSTIGMLSYLQGTTRPDISFAVNQCARFSNNPRQSHEVAVKQIVRYLLASRDKGIIFKPDVSRGLECYADADFAGSWSKATSAHPDSVLSRTGFVIFYAGCPLLWSSKLQTEIALSTAEAEYISLSSGLREVIPLMTLLKEVAPLITVNTSSPIIHCKVYEDNKSCISMATKQKYSARTKHIAIKYHHFRHHVTNGSISINYVNTHDQIADLLTKPLSHKMLAPLRKRLMGW